MKDIKPGMFFIAADGDGVGKLVGRAVIANDVEELHKVSNRIDAAQDFILHWCKDVGGTKISGGGDEFSAAIPKEALKKIEALRKSVEKSFGYTLSIGVGKSLSEGGTALLVAKLRGKNRIVYFNNKIKEDIKKAKRRVREGRASQEEYKLSEAYLEKSENMRKICELHKKEEHKKHKLHKHEEGAHDSAATEDDVCPYCQDDEDNRTDDCSFCADLDAVENADGTAGMDNCPACQDYDSEKQTTGGIDTDNCPYCDNESLEQANPEQDQAVAADDANPSTNGPNDCPECQKMYGDAVENEPDQTGQEDPNLQGHETAEEVLDLLDQEPGSGAETPSEEAKQIDNTELPQGDAMEEGTSVPEDFGDAQKNDISDSEAAFGQSGQESGQPEESGQDEPDMTGVLQSGLDDHANDQKKQQVLDMVAQTLQGFKANKQSLEATKEQNQPLYNSCIQMLKSMIELCKLLGLQPQMPSDNQTMPGAPAEAQEAPPASPVQAAPSEGAAQDPKTQAG
jgi:hypothetical protein